MKCKPLKKIGSSLPKGFARAELYSDIGFSCDPSPFGCEDSDDEDSSTGTLSDDDIIGNIPVLLVPPKKKKVPTVILEEETDFK